MEITLANENGNEGKVYKKGKATMFDAMLGMEFNIRQVERFVGKEAHELTHTREGLEVQIEGMKDAAEFVAQVFNNEFSANDLLKGIPQSEFDGVVSKVLLEVTGGEVDEEKKD
ncbi:hypothetical protein ACP46T_000492 [Listeria monocytogenes]|uniref:phage tail assembly chaperone G n=1 Tax=Listeria TaxID=1637 RepID=UPI00061DB6ED|nr:MULTISPECIES: hypothetical protein [Listeria]EAC2431449.1 hypothetical protein [Listeria monocytogenes]EAC6733280.1 hypothetical protein [Listeria monocytogenes]EAD6458319.1 hypothetical protein [Listeria monocytogenes]EAD6470501.1 hypothetical protein [Listeria monocytogenes]EAD6595150.1 hypothetical protein [Listeria monocytogenes]